MSVTTTCRDINQLHPVAQKACKLFMDECKKAGLNIFITETYRSQERQNYLYAQGRTRPGNVVTWTRQSRHTSKLAWDIAVNPPKSLYDISELNKAGAIAKKLGITWGGTWTTSIDRPHFEVTTSWQAPSVAAPKPPVQNNSDVVYYLLTGTFGNKAEVTAAQKRMKDTSDTRNWYTSIVQDGTRYRIQTGTFGKKAEAENALSILKNKFRWDAYLKERKK